MTEPTFTPNIPTLGRFRAYTEALRLAAAVRGIAVTGHLRDQLLRAVDSVVLNLAEGGADGTRAQKARYFGIARASPWEAGAAIDLVAISGERVAHIAAAIATLDHALRPLARRRSPPRRGGAPRRRPRLRGSRERRATSSC